MKEIEERIKKIDRSSQILHGSNKRVSIVFCPVTDAWRCYTNSMESYGKTLEGAMGDMENKIKKEVAKLRIKAKDVEKIQGK